jgi:adenine-specific DNA-methyltransferase
LGQFMTPAPIAKFMASLFELSNLKTCKLLDAGAGVGALSTAFLDRIRNENRDIEKIEIKAFEIDSKLRKVLEEVLSCHKTIVNDFFEVREDVDSTDFIEYAAKQLLIERMRPFTHAILNPPYKKLSSDSEHRFLLREVGIETVNLYSAFVALGIELLKSEGQLVAIIPRSFCNGTYYRQFRELILQKTAIRQIHLFDARDKVFGDDNVLQENVIIFLQRDAKQKDVVISRSTDGSFSDYSAEPYNFERIVNSLDKDNFIHIPESKETNILKLSPVCKQELSNLFVEVSTGPVVDFRVKEHIRKMPDESTVPLFYPGHFDGNNVEYPKLGWKKPNAIEFNKATEKWLFPKGFYTVVRRFSSKEQKRRIYASVVNPNSFPDTIAFGFENHLNVFHLKKRGITEFLAFGLACFLNSTIVDRYFRSFSGHTQVNATDLRKLIYPDFETLTELGKWAKRNENHTQEMIDAKLMTLI